VKLDDTTIVALVLACTALGISSCSPQQLVLPIETEFSLLNLSRDWYATIALRPTSPAGASEAEYVQSPLLPPGAVFRRRFLELFPQTGGCPDFIDLRVHLYKRVNADVPIGLDPGEAVVPQAIASGEAVGVNACGGDEPPSATYTIVLRDSAEGTIILRIAQGTGREVGLEFSGAEAPELDQIPPLLDAASLDVSVLTSDGRPLAGVGVLLRTRVRPDVDPPPACCSVGPSDPNEATQCCWGAPVAIGVTDDAGAFEFERPPGAYLVEAFADGLLFRPPLVVIESPLDNVTFIAEETP
jgi:hypothetical protein